MNYNKLSIGCTLGISSLILLLGIIFVVMHHTILSNQIHLKLNENCPIIKIIDDIQLDSQQVMNLMQSPGQQISCLSNKNQSEMMMSNYGNYGVISQQLSTNNRFLQIKIFIEADFTYLTDIVASIGETDIQSLMQLEQQKNQKVNINKNKIILNMHKITKQSSYLVLFKFDGSKNNISQISLAMFSIEEFWFFVEVIITYLLIAIQIAIIALMIFKMKQQQSDGNLNDIQQKQKKIETIILVSSFFLLNNEPLYLLDIHLQNLSFTLLMKILMILYFPVILYSELIQSSLKRISTIFNFFICLFLLCFQVQQTFSFYDDPFSSNINFVYLAIAIAFVVLIIISNLYRTNQSQLSKFFALNILIIYLVLIGQIIYKICLLLIVFKIFQNILFYTVLYKIYNTEVIIETTRQQIYEPIKEKEEQLETIKREVELEVTIIKL